MSRLPRLLLRSEGVVVAAAAGIAYFHEGSAWWWLVAFVLGPDLSMLGYVGGTRVGSLVYNAAHTYVAPTVLLCVGVTGGRPLPIQIALIWGVHIGFDRALGYGLKYSDDFKHTHLQEV